MYEIIGRTGDVLDVCATLEAAQEEVESLEFVDKEDGLYEDGFYEIREHTLNEGFG